MGLRDFFKKGKEEPVKPTDPTNRQPGDSTFFKQDATQPAQQATSQDTYTVQSGDSLSKIAKKQYGDMNAWKKIYEANKQTIGDNPDLIKPGQRLIIPK